MHQVNQQSGIVSNRFPVDPFASILKMDIPDKFITQLSIDETKIGIPRYQFKTNNPIFIEYRTNDLNDNSYQKLCVCIDFDKKVKDVWFHHFYRPWQREELKTFIRDKVEERALTTFETVNADVPTGDKALVLGDMVQFCGKVTEDELNKLYKTFTKEERVKKLISTEFSEKDKLDDLLFTENKFTEFEFKNEDIPSALGPTNIMDKIKREKSFTLNELLVEDDLIRKWKEYLDAVQEDEGAESSNSSSATSKAKSLRARIKTGSTYSNPKSTTPATYFRDDFQGRLFTIMNDYRDLYFPNSTSDNHRVCVETYTLHIVNHLLK